MSLRLRVGVLAALGVGIAVALTALAGYFTVADQLQRSVDQNLLERAQEAVNTQFGVPSKVVLQDPETILAADLRIGLIRPDGGMYVANEESAPPVGKAEVAVALGHASHSARTITNNGESMRVVAVPAGPRLALVLAQPTGPTDAILTRLKTVSVVVGGAGIALALWAGFSIAQTGLRPVTKLTEAAENVAATGRLDPIDVEGSDEIARLTHSFNAMLAAVRQSQLRQSQLVADAGHELRTPLTSMRTNLDLLAQTEAEGRLPDDERKALIADVRAQAEELTQLVGDLVELSRDDPPTTTFEPIDLADIVTDAIARVRRRAPRITFESDVQSWTVNGDASALSRAVTNLLDNAAKFSPAEGTVTVTLHGGTLHVTDDGPGISEDDLPHVFERFYRSPEARSRPGSGLGLSIVKATAERHSGVVGAGAADGGGARLSMTIPASG